MPVEVAPNRIELAQLLGGFAPDPEEASLPLDQSPDMLNLLPDLGSGALELRKGFKRPNTNARIETLEGWWIRHCNYYEVIDSGARERFLVCILTNGTNADPDNIQVWVYDLVADTFARVDTAGRSWANAKTEHWYAIVEGTYYGGTRGEVIYSWHPTNGWKADPTTPNVKTWVNDVDGAVDPGTEFAKDYAFRKGEKVTTGSKFYSSTRNIRFKDWESGQRYDRGERVSRKATIGGSTYWRSFQCIDKHTADATNRPGDGSGTPTDYWKKVKLESPRNEDDDVSDDWIIMPLPGKGVVGAYHGFRLFVRHDDADNWTRLQYSAPAHPERNTEIADLDFDPKDWAPIDDISGDGGGWQTVPFVKGDAIRALQSYGSYLIVAGRWETFVLAGTNESTWNLRRLGAFGAIGPQSITELDGLVYLLGPWGGLAVTDGTSIRAVEGIDKIREFLKDRIDKLMVGQDTYNWHPALVAYAGMLWITLPNDSGADITIVYEPKTASWYQLDIPMLDMAVGEKGRAQRAWFSTAITGAADQYPCIFNYRDDPGNELYTDDDYTAEVTGVGSTLNLSWRHRTGWFQFGTTRNERRLRRLWALVTGEVAQTVTVDVYEDFEEGSVLTTAARTLDGTAQAEFVEGQVGQKGDVYAIATKLSGTANAQLAVHGYGIDTEPRRTRFHRN